MARADLLVNLVRAGAAGDKALFQKTVEAVIAEERAQQHHIVADRLAAYIGKNSASQSGVHPRFPSDTEGLFLEFDPRRLLADVVLPDAVETACRELIEEHQRCELLRSHGLEPRHRVLLIGPPGNGKTSLAEALAAELLVPLLVVRYEGVIGSYLGETAVRLARLFDHVRSRQCVLFFDEFDAIGKERGDAHETGEIKRVVSSLLLQIDALPSHVVVVAATNHAELLDRAAWRRFQMRLEIPPPTHVAVARWLGQFEERAGVRFGIAHEALAEQLAGLSFAELEEFCLDVQRRHILASPRTDVAAVTRSRLSQWQARRGPAT